MHRNKWTRRLAVPMTALLVLILGSTLAACSSTPNASSSSKLNTANPFLIASPNDATGALKDVVGVQWKAGLEAATADINAHGGILSREVVVDYEDTESSPTVAATVLTTMLASKHYDAIIPTATDGLSELQVSNAHHIIDVWPAEPLNAPDPSVYPTHFDPDYELTQQGQELSCMIKQELPAGQPKTAGYIYTELPSDESAFQSVSKYAAADGFQLVATEGFKAGSLDVTPELSKIEAAHPSMLIIGALSGDENTVFSGLNALDYHPKIMGDWFLSANPPSQYVSQSNLSAVPQVLPTITQAINTRLNGHLSSAQKDAIAAVKRYIPGGQIVGGIWGYLFDYDSLFLVKFAADKAHSDSTPAMVRALESLAKHPVSNIGTIFDPSPRFSPTNHGYYPSVTYVANMNGQDVSGTWPAISNTPLPMSCPA